MSLQESHVGTTFPVLFVGNVESPASLWIGTQDIPTQFIQKGTSRDRRKYTNAAVHSLANFGAYRRIPQHFKVTMPMHVDKPGTEYFAGAVYHSVTLSYRG
jgi:hypothetical protein